jgi:hypothetical protein
MLNTSLSQRADSVGAVRRARLQMRALAIGMAVVANTVVLAVARIVNGEFPVADDQSIAFVQVIFVTIVVGLFAWGLLELLERVTPRAATIWIAVAIVFFLLSLIGPFASGDNTFSKIVLALIHLGAFIAIVPTMWRSATLQCD